MRFADKRMSDKPVCECTVNSYKYMYVYTYVHVSIRFVFSMLYIVACPISDQACRHDELVSC